MTISNRITILPPNPADSDTSFWITGIVSNGPLITQENQQPAYLRAGVYSGEFENNLGISWGIYSPESNSVIREDYLLSAQDSFSGFNVDLYLVTGNIDYTGQISGSDKVFLTGDTGILLDKEITLAAYFSGASGFYNPIEGDTPGVGLTGDGGTGISGVARYFEFNIIGTDIYTGKCTGSILLTNPPPTVDPFYFTGINTGDGSVSTISGSVPYYTTTGIASGEFSMDYSIQGSTETPSFTPNASICFFTGLNSGESGTFDFTGTQFDDYMVRSGNFTGVSGTAIVGLQPFVTGYAGMLPFDSYGGGFLRGLYGLETGLFENLTSYVSGGTTYYITGYDFVTGFSDPYPLFFEPSLTSITTTGIRVSGGNAVFYDVYTNFSPDTFGLTSEYRVSGDGKIYSGYSGYDYPLYASSGDLSGKIEPPNYSSDSTYSFYQDNANDFFYGWASGGNFWKEGPPADGFSSYYTGADFSGFGLLDQIVSSGYTYAVFDSSTSLTTALRREDLASLMRPVSIPNAGLPNVETGLLGCFSMPINDPNSMDIKFRTGYGFNNVTYEEAQAQLRDTGEMLAVFMYPGQIQKAAEAGSQTLENGEIAFHSGYIGLRRGKTNIISPSPNYTGQWVESGVDEAGDEFYSTGVEFSPYFKTWDYSRISGSGETASLNLDSYDIYNNYLFSGLISEPDAVPSNSGGAEWCWVNNSGDSIYRIAGTGQKIRNFSADFALYFTGKEIFTIEDVVGYIPPIGFQNTSLAFQGMAAYLSFSGDPDYYDNGDGIGRQQTFSGYKVFTGTYPGALPLEDANLAVETGNVGSQYQILYELTGDINPYNIRYLLYDEVGSGYASQTFDTHFKKGGAEGQFGVESLDPEYFGGRNYKNIEFFFPFEDGVVPQITHNIYYTGSFEDCPNVMFLGAIISGFATGDMTFILSDVVPDTGYAIAWSAQAKN